MAKPKLREAIAKEAARLILRGNETEYLAARRKAARWLSRKKVHPHDLPTHGEIQAQLYSLAGLFTDGGQAVTSPNDPLTEDQRAAQTEHVYHPDTFAMMQMLLERLANVVLDSQEHPEGDALYHSLQVFELGRSERPYDEEFLLACLLHDVGVGIDRRNPVRSTLQALGNLVTDRTRFLIEHRSAAMEYLKTGKIPRSLRRSEHFDDLVQLARHDRDGRVRGAEVGSAVDALEYVAGLSTAWDEV